MRAGRIRLIHVIVIVVVLLVALVTIKSGRLGINRIAESTQSAIVVPLGTPTSSDDQILASAHTLDLDGRYEDARSTLLPLMHSPIPATAANALLATAKIEIELGATDDAIADLKSLRTKYPQSPAANDAQLILGQSLATSGDNSGAIRELTSFSKRNADIAPYVDLLIAQYLDAEGKWKNALSQASAIAADTVIGQVKIEALKQVAKIQQVHSSNSDYVQTLNKLLDLATDPDYRAQLLFERGDTEIVMGQNTTGTADFHEVVTQYPDSTFAVRAAARLDAVEKNAAVSEQQTGLIEYDASQYQDAVDAFTRALAANPHDDKAWYYRALSTLSLGNDQAAMTQLDEMTGMFPQSQFLPEALYTVGRLNEDYGNLKAAQANFQSVIQRAPNSDSAMSARMRLGFIRYLQGDFSGAISSLREVHGNGPTLAQASFWSGKALQKLGQSADAQVAWTKSEQSDPNSYYGLRSAQLLVAPPSTTSSPTSAVQQINRAPTATEQTVLDGWYMAEGTTAQETVALVEQDAGYQRMTHLFAVGLTQQAELELSAFADRNSHNLPALAALGDLLLNADQYNATYRVGLALQTDATALKVTIPDVLNRLAYPIAFPDVVISDSLSNKVDPLLFLSLVRQESGYDPSVSSSADAKGLAQIVPETASVLASALGIKDWRADLLYRPYIGGELGTVYLADRMAKFDNSIPEALAAYNAGDSNAAEWASDAAMNDPDVFIEAIPFTETYAYVQKVYANYLNYIRLYR